MGKKKAKNDRAPGEELKKTEREPKGTFVLRLSKLRYRTVGRTVRTGSLRSLPGRRVAYRPYYQRTGCPHRSRPSSIFSSNQAPWQWSPIVQTHGRPYQSSMAVVQCHCQCQCNGNANGPCPWQWSRAPGSAALQPPIRCPDDTAHDPNGPDDTDRSYGRYGPQVRTGGYV